MKGDFRIVEQFRYETVHMRHLGALLAGIEAGAGRFKARAVHRPCCKFGNCIGRAGVEPDPGIANRLVVSSDQPCTVTLAGDGNSGSALA